MLPSSASFLPAPRRAGAVRATVAAAITVLGLSACGGGDDNGASLLGSDARMADNMASFSAEFPGQEAEAAAVRWNDADSGIEAQTLFHAAPRLLAAPADTDAQDPMASSRQSPRLTMLDAFEAARTSRGLTVQGILAQQEESRRQRLGTAAGGEGSAARPLADSAAVSTFTPAQIRAAYGLPALPAAGTAVSAMSAEQRAQLGAGQTVYVIAAKHDPNIAAELAAFNAKFGLPGCSTKAIAPNTTLPLAAASATEGCSLSVVYTTSTGAMSASAPAYDAGWATEIALDVQWVHATAPLARIVLIEAPDAAVGSLAAAVRLANSMGPGVVSMSFGSSEGSWSASYEGSFTGNGMSYVAATGDAGPQVSWPAVSPRVLAVGGTSLGWSGSGMRSETAWNLTGGGMSAYMALPTYQQGSLPGGTTLARRGVADVAFNANPATGQYVAVINPGSSTPNWISAGGTSLAAPQWAGLLAVAQARRAAANQARFGAPHELLYRTLAAGINYASTFADINNGSHGSCGSCSARGGYDQLTGLGTPQGESLLNALATGSVSSGGTTADAGATTPSPAPAAPSAPVVASGSITGQAGTALTVALKVTASHPLTFALERAPAGMTVSSTGVIAWPAPVAGTTTATVIAKDAKTGLGGTGTVTFNIAAAPSASPVINAPALSGVAGKALTGIISFSDPAGKAMGLSITGVPMGMGFSVANPSVKLTWPSPTRGSYTLIVTVRTADGRSAERQLPVTINAK